MAQQHIDYNDILPSLAARGTIVLQPKTISPNSLSLTVPGCFLDPVSGRLDNIGDRYYRNPVPTWLRGRGDFVEHGQLPGNIPLHVPNLFQQNDEVEFLFQNGVKVSVPNWLELKVSLPDCKKKDSTYTNPSAKY